MTSGIAAPYPRLLGDVGGSRARFGWIEEAGSAITAVESLRSGDHAGLEAAIARYLASLGRAQPRSCAIGIAAPVTGDVVAMTNRTWTFSISDLQRSLGLDRILVINDYAALAHALVGVRPDEVRRVGGGEAVANAPLGLVGPGTGLGVSGLLVAPGGGSVPVVGEGGHVSLSAADAVEDSVIAILRRRFGHVSAERALSGPGLVNLYAASCELGGRPIEALEPVEVTERARLGNDAGCRQAIDLFFAFLGSVAGDLALTLGARGGVYVAGGIVAQLGDEVTNSAFRERFEAKGRYSGYLARIPTAVVVDASGLALRGADAALDA
ncbi:MAG TPA: glucokinase [Caldimonas sp.]|jgi:glucokinase|nr:glucokinase [Caldimonas sp.]HEX4235651.1 glucokinase [Caldimonas sp.]